MVALQNRVEEPADGEDADGDDPDEGGEELGLQHLPQE